MRFPHLAFLGALLATAGLGAACSNTTETTSQTGATTGAGGSGGDTSSTTTTIPTVTPDAGPPLDHGQPSDKYPAPHPPPPTVQYFGGAVLHTPKVVPIFFSNDDATLTGKVTDFLSKLGATQYWSAVASEYGVGALESLSPINLGEAAPASITDDQIQAWLVAKMTPGGPDFDETFPMPDGSTIFVVHYPAGTTVKLPDGQGGVALSCDSFGGYHQNITIGGVEIPYAVVPRCGNFGGLGGIDDVTGAESHELVEAVTDPFPFDSAPGYAQPDQNHLYYEFVLGGGEVGDMCAQDPTSFTKFAELPYVVQRSWSNKAAKAGHDPCQPSLPGSVYFAAAPVMKDQLSLGQGLSMKGVKVAVGDSKTIEVDLFSDAPTSGPFTIEAFDASQFMGGSPSLDLSLDKESGVNGEKVYLTINAIKKSQYGAAVFVLQASLGGERHWWLGIAGN